jgi:dTDP-4-dehydrorhamnose reductase
MLNKIVLLGSKGMLGQMVNRYFKQKGFEIFTFDKRFNEDTVQNYVDEINKFDSSIIINCIGRIKQKSDSAYDLFLSNTLLPLELARSLKANHLLIHPSTDCVFNGKTVTPYLSYEKHTATDIYGISKSLGETAIVSRSNSLILRVSIIGPDKNSDKGLLSWFLNNSPDSELNGFKNHLWNGITTLEWSEMLFQILQNEEQLNELLKRKIIQLGTECIYTKYEMLEIFNSTFNKGFKINAVDSEFAINRCLKPEMVAKTLEYQMEDLNIFMKNNALL